MKQLFFLSLWLCFLFLFFCDPISAKSKKDIASVTIDTVPFIKRININKDEILKDFQSWYGYSYYNINLAQNFTGLTVDSVVTGKPAFLALLLTGNFIAFKVAVQNNVPVYQLYKPEIPNKEIQDIVKQEAQQELSNDAMEGKEFPDFNLTDINGTVYNKANTKGKIVVVKCWFIRCVACVAEFPKLNKLADGYRKNKDVVFISLARDAKPDLVAFLAKKKFNYAVIAEQESYMDKLGINMFPTHILLDGSEKIIKVTNAIDDLIPALKNETEKATFNKP